MDLQENTTTDPDFSMGMPDEDETKVSPLPLLQGMAPETVNIAEAMADEDLKKIGEKVCRDFQRDLDSSKKYRERRASILKLFLGDLPEQIEGEEFANAQVHYPIIAKAVMRIHARIYDQQFPSNGEYFGVKPTDALDLDRALRVAKHLNWQIIHQIPEYVPNHDALIMQWLLYGSAFSYMYWDPIKNRPCHEVCRTEDIVLPYKRSSTDPSLGDMPRITRVLRKYRHELEDMEDSSYFIGIEELFEELDEKDEGTGASATDYDQQKHAVQEVIDRDSGVKKPENDPDAPRELLEQHRWLKLPGEKRQKPVIVTVDKQTKRVLCLKLREDEDPQDKARFNREQDANNAQYAAAMMQWQVDMAAYEMGLQAPMGMGQQHMMPDGSMMAGPPMDQMQTMTQAPMMGEMSSAGPMMGGGAPGLSVGDRVRVRQDMNHDEMTENAAGTVSIINGTAIGVKFDGADKVHKWYVAEELEPIDGQTMTQPPEPGEMSSTGPMMPMPAPPPEPPPPAPVKMVPINFFVHYICIPNPEGVYGFGVGSLLEGNNMAADTLSSQIVDAATLANTKGGFISRQMKADRGDLHFRPGEFIQTETMGQDLSKMIHVVDFPGPEPAMGQLVKDQKEEAEELSGAGDILSGEVGGSNETATTTQIRISQAMAAIAIWNKRYTRARTVEGEHLARLNSVHLEDEEYFTVVDPYGNVPGAPPAGAPPAGMPPMGAPPIMGGPGSAPPASSPGNVPPLGPPSMPPPVPGPEVQKVPIGRMDYLLDTNITVTADPRMASQPQRFQEAQTIMGVVNSTPLLAAMPPVVMAAAKLIFQSIDNTIMTQALAQGMAMGPMMGPPPPGGGPPPKEGGGGPPQPENPGPSVPNAGPQPANGTAPEGQVA